MSRQEVCNNAPKTKEFNVLNWLTINTQRRIKEYRTFLNEHPSPYFMTDEESQGVTATIEVLEQVLEDIETAKAALQPWMAKGSLVDFHMNMASPEVTTPGVHILSDVADMCGSLCVRVEKEGLVCVKSLTPAQVPETKECNDCWHQPDKTFCFIECGNKSQWVSKESRLPHPLLKGEC